MAQINDLVVSLKQHLSCTICQDLFRQPKTLVPCLHNFCLDCIEGLYEAARKKGQRLTCPICNTIVDIPEGKAANLKNAFYLESLRDLLRVIQSKASQQDNSNLPNCASCDENVSLVAFCPECEGMVCAKCEKVHHTVKMLREEHQVTLFGDLKKEHLNTFIGNQQRCPEKFHGKFNLEYFCKTCDKTICQKCSITEHNNHEKIDLERKA